MKNDFSETLLCADATLRDAMTLMDQSGEGVAFMLDDHQVLLGLLTDGDIRRAILSGVSINVPAGAYLNRKYIAGSVGVAREKNLALLSDRVRCLPVLDPEGRMVDMLRWKDLYRLPVMEPVLKGREFEYVTDCLATNWISSQGKYVERFEESFRTYLPVTHALSVANGTASLHLALAALGIGPGDEVIVPDLTFVAPASMVLLCGAQPVFVDVDPTTWTIDPSAIEARISSKTRAIIPVHLYGHPCDMDPILAVAKKHRLFVIEDCAEALGAEYKGRKVGTLGDVGTFSFFANKVITTGEGGMVTTSNPELHHKMQLLRDHGMTREKRYWHNVAGFNYRLTNLQAAIGLAQMEQIEDFLRYRAQVVERYNEQLRHLPGVTLPPCADWAKNIYWLYSIVIDEEVAGVDRDGLIARLPAYGIDTRPFFFPLHPQPPFATEALRSFPHAERLARCGLSLPTSNNIEFSDIDRVCRAIKSILGG
jgi:perosamine synthetase